MNIDWNQALIAGIAGGLLGALFVITRLVYAKLAPRFGGFVAVLLCLAAIVAVGAVGAYTPLGDAVASYVAKKRAETRLTRVMAEHMRPVLESPDYQERFAGLSPEQAGALAWQLSSEGLLRLPDERLIRRIHLLNEAIAASDEAACGSQLQGPTPEQAQRLLENLSEESLAEWFDLTAEAFAASLRDDPSRLPSQSEMQQALRRILAALPEPEARSLAEALGNMASLDPSESCWAARKIYQTAVSLPEEDQALLARVLAVQ